VSVHAPPEPIGPKLKDRNGCPVVFTGGLPVKDCSHCAFNNCSRSRDNPGGFCEKGLWHKRVDLGDEGPRPARAHALTKEPAHAILSRRRLTR